MKFGQIFLLTLVCCSGCTAVIIPPATKGTDTVPVVVADYGYHSTVIFPKSDGGMIEYAFGDWTFFGQSEKTVGNALHALIHSDQATLGRRLLDRDPRQSGLAEATGAKVLIRFDAPREKVLEMEKALDRRFSEHLDTIMYSDVHHLYFVKDDDRYNAAHNCNHFTADLLESLGCHIQGVVLTSDFKLGDNGEPPSRTHEAKDMSTPRLASHE
jgi:hypothetical protein